MSNNVKFYENKYYEIYKQTKQLYDIKNGNLSIGSGIDTLIARSEIESMGIPQNLSPEITAVINMLKTYSEKQIAHHKSLAMAIMGFLNILVAPLSVRKTVINQNKQLLTIACLIVAPTFGIDNMSTTKPTEEQSEAIADEAVKQLAAPTLDFQKNFLQFFLKSSLKKCNLAENKSDFASLLFVIIKKLNLNIENDLMKKIITGANFSQGFLHCGSNTSRKLHEIASLNNNTPEEKPSLRI